MTGTVNKGERQVASWGRRVGKIGVALLASVALRALVGRVVPGVSPYALLYPAIAYAGTTGGTPGGLIVTAIGLLIANYLWIAPYFPPVPHDAANLIGAGLYFVAAMTIIWVTHACGTAKRRLQLYFDGAAVMLVVVGKDRRIEAVNAHGAELLGAPAAELVGQDWFESFVPAAVRQSRRAAFAELMNGHAVSPAATEIVTRNGDMRLIKWHQTLLRDIRGRPRAALASGHDITAAVAGEAAVRRSEALLTAVLRQVPAAVSIIEAPDGRLTLRSDRTMEVLGAENTKPGDVVDWSNYHGIHADGTPFTQDEYPIMRALRQEEIVEGERFQYRKPSGSVVDLEVYAAPIREPNGKVVAAMGIAFDTTVRAEAERKLRLSEESLRSALDSRDMVVREANHRIKNSLQLVTSLLNMQRRHAANEQTADSLAQAIARVNAIAESHVALQSSEDLQVVDFAEMLAGICLRLGELSEAVRVVCIFEDPLVLDIDRAIPLALITSELITNSLRHAYPVGQEGAVHVETAIRGTQLIVHVRDQGKGFGVGNARSGLGTRVINSLAGQIACTVVSDSKPGEGTTVTVSMEINPPKPPEER